MTTKYGKQFQLKIDYLNRILNRPPESWTKQENGRYKANIGNLHIDYNTPGDTRYNYRLVEMVTDGGGIRGLSNVYMTAREFLGFLNGMITFAEMERK